VRKFIVFWLILMSANAFASDSDYHIIKRLKVGGEGGWDYLTVDESSRRLVEIAIPPTVLQLLTVYSMQKIHIHLDKLRQNSIF